MHGRPDHFGPVAPSAPSHPDRWRILGVLVVALLVTSIDHAIINVALPQMVRDLDATAAGLQWIVAAYTVVFAGPELWGRDADPTSTVSIEAWESYLEPA